MTESHSACNTRQPIDTWPGGASANVVHKPSPTATTEPTSVSLDSMNDANVSEGDGVPAAITSSAGDRTGSNVDRNLVGAPFSPAVMEKAQNWLVEMRWVMTSWTVQPSHLLGDAHWSSSRCASSAPNRLRCRTISAIGSALNPSTLMIGSAP